MGQRRCKRTAAGVTMEAVLTAALNTDGHTNANGSDKNDNSENNNNGRGLGDKGSCQSARAKNSRGRLSFRVGKENAATPLVDAQTTSVRVNNPRGRLSSRACKENENATPLADIQKTCSTRRQRSRGGKAQVRKQIDNDAGSLRVENGSGGENPPRRRSGRNKSKAIPDVLDKENKEIAARSEDVVCLEEDGSSTKDCFVSGQVVSPAGKRGSKRRSVPDSNRVRSKRKCVEDSGNAGALAEKNIVHKDDKADAGLEKHPTKETDVMLPNESPERQQSPATETGIDNAETGSNSVPNNGEKMVADILVSSDDDRSTKGLNMNGTSLHQSQHKEYGHPITSAMEEMQQMYSKLHAKYKRLKARRHDDIEAYIGEQTKKFTAYVNAAEELLEHLRNDNSRLRLEAIDANSNIPMALSRQNSLASLLECKIAECQNDLLIERGKSLELMEQVKRLQQLLSEQGAMSKNVQNNNLHSSNHCFSVSEEQYSCSQEKSVVLQSERQEAIADISCVGLEEFSKFCPSNPTFKHVGVQTENFQTVCDNCCLECTWNAEASHKANSSKVVDSQFRKDAAKGDATNLDLVRANGLLQSLLQCMVGLTFSVAEEGKFLQLFVLHQSSGYSFKLKCLSAENDPKFMENGELLYHVVSLGTLQKIAPDWMKEEIIFSVGQINLFFERILQVANGRGHHLLVR